MVEVYRDIISARLVQKVQHFLEFSPGNGQRRESRKAHGAHGPKNWQLSFFHLHLTFRGPDRHRRQGHDEASLLEPNAVCQACRGMRACGLHLQCYLTCLAWSASLQRESQVLVTANVDDQPKIPMHRCTMLSMLLPQPASSGPR